MNFIEGSSRREIDLLPACLDDYVEADSPAREIDSFVESLDLEECGFSFPKTDSKGRGRPAYHPKSLLKLFIYGYMNGLRSGRKLEKACKLNLEVIWLMQKLRPDFKTICDFRKENSDCFKTAAAKYSLNCYREGYIDGKLLAVDGSRIKAQNAPEKSWSKAKLANFITHVEKEINEYLRRLEEADNCPVPADKKLHEYVNSQLDHLKDKKKNLESLQEELEKSGTNHLSLTDKDAKILKKNGSIVVGYNAQTTVDSKHGLIICSEVTNSSNDMGLLGPMAIQAKEILDLDEVDAVADKGYYSAEDFKNCEKNNITTHISEVMMSPSERQGLFGKRHFIYDPENDSYTCPANHELARVQKEKGDKKQWSYRNRKACKDCPIKDRCTKSSYRTIKRTENDPYLEKNRARLSHNKDIRRQRKAIVEPPFSWLKLHSLIGGFLTKGLAMVNAEFSLSQLAFNLKRVMKIKENKRRTENSRPIMAICTSYLKKRAPIKQFMAA